MLGVRSVLGIGTARYVGALPSPQDPRQIIISQGPALVSWNLRTLQRDMVLLDHSHLISGIWRMPQGGVLSVSYGGEVFLRDGGYKVIARKEVPKGHLTHLSVSRDASKVLVFSQTPGGVLTEFLHQKDGLEQGFEIGGQYFFAEFSEEGHIVAVLEDLYNDKVAGAALCLLDGRTGSVILSKPLPKGKVITAKVSGNQMALAYSEGRNFEVVSMSNLDTLYSFTAAGTGLVVDFLFYNNHSILVPSSNGKGSLWIKGQLSKQLSLPAVMGRSIHWSLVERDLWILNEDAIYLIENLGEENQNIIKHSYYELSCCGIDIHPNGSSIAAGDLSSQVIVWDINSSSIIHRTMVGFPVRCLCWNQEGTLLFIGCLDGNIFIWDLHHEPVIFATLPDGVTSIKWDNSEVPKMLAAGTTDGTLAILECEKKGEGYPSSVTKLSYKAHLPSTEGFNDQFGSLHKFSEIWSVAWSPDSTRIATASEDQTIVIWNLAGESLAKLTGHTTAVTSVDWKTTSLGDILVSCADDRTIRVWKESQPNQWELYHIFQTEHLTEWHTVTYISLQHQGSHLVCSTQSGYVFVFDMATKREVFCGRMHLGSVEGVIWHKQSQLIASCSSDCNLIIYTFEDVKK